MACSTSDTMYIVMACLARFSRLHVGYGVYYTDLDLTAKLLTRNL